jgi:hypothetical protein
MSGEKWSDMNDEKLKEVAEFEDKHEATVISPNLLQQLAGMEKIAKEQAKPKQHFFYVAWQDDSGRIIDIKHYDDYDTALLKAMGNAKTTGTTYTIRDLNGRFIDGNYVSR